MKWIKWIFPICVVLFYSCKKESQELRTERIAEYYPLQVGKYTVYKLDSTVYTNLGTKKEIRSYIIQDRIDSLITDNLGRPSYKIRRSIRSNADTTRWLDLTSFLITFDSTKQRLELIQDNQRYIRLLEPIKNGFSWNAHTFINTLGLPEIQYLQDWNYVYEQVKKSVTINNIVFKETFTVNQRKDTLGTPSNKNFYFEINSGKEVFAKGKGLIFKEFLHEAWQPPNGSSTSGYYEANSYGIKLTYLSSN